MDGLGASPISGTDSTSDFDLLQQMAAKKREEKAKSDEKEDEGVVIPSVPPQVYHLDDLIEEDPQAPQTPPDTYLESKIPQILLQKEEEQNQLDESKLTKKFKKLSISEPSPRKPLETRRIIRGSDVVSEGIGEIMALARVVDQTIKRIQYSLESIAQDMWWKKFPDCRAIKASSKIMKSNLTELVNQESRMQDLWEQVAVISQNNVIPDIFKRLQLLEVSFDLVNERCSQMRVILKSKAFGMTYEWYKEVSKCLLEIKKDQGEENVQLLMNLCDKSFFKTVDERHETLDLEVRQEVKKLHKEATYLVLQAMSYVAKNTPEATNDHEEQWNVIQRKLSEYERRVLSTQKNEKTDWAISKEDVAKVSLKKSLDGNFCFESPQRGSGVRWLFGYDATAWKIIGEMEEIAKGILGFGREVEESLRSFIEGKFVQKPSSRLHEDDESSDGATEFNNIYDKHCAFYAYFEQCLEVIKGNLFSQELNSLEFNVFDYSSGLSSALMDIRTSLNLLRRFYKINEQYKDIVTSQMSLFNYLNPTKISGSRDETCLGKIESFYFSSAKFQFIKDKHDGHLSGKADRFIRRTKETIEATLIEKGTDILELTERESMVWHSITGQKMLDDLFYEGEEANGLPAVIRSYFEKCITNLMFYTEKKYDQRINVLIYILSNRKMYEEHWRFSLDKHLNFAKIVRAYLDSLEFNMLENTLEGISDVFLCIHKAALPKQRDELAYGQAWQKLFDFYYQRKETWNDEMNSLVAIAYEELCDVAVEKDYVRIYFDRGFSIEKKEFNPKVLDLSTVSESESIGVFEATNMGLIYRLLGYCIWGSDMDQRRMAHAIVDQLLENKSFLMKIEQNNQEARDTRSMIYKNTIQKILRGNYKAVRTTELEILRMGPIRKCLEGNCFDLRNSEIFLVMLWLVHLGDSNIIADITKAMGPEEFEARFNGPAVQFFASMQGFWQAQMMGNSIVFNSFGAKK